MFQNACESISIFRSFGQGLCLSPLLGEIKTVCLEGWVAKLGRAKILMTVLSMGSRGSVSRGYQLVTSLMVRGEISLAESMTS
jgi:hypothetical protein